MTTPLAGPVDRAGEIVAIDRDALLQASRRVDWRFSLPHPDLTDIAYIGRANPSLLASLQQFCSSLTILENVSPDSFPAGQFPIVVAHNPNQLEMASAVQAVSFNGFVYLEISQSRRGLKQLSERFSHGIQHYLSEMSRLGLTNQHAYWHWPDFGHSTNRGYCKLIEQQIALHRREVT